MRHAFHTMLPRKETGSMVNARRQNDSNLNDSTTLNGMMRVKLIRDGYADYLADWASDTTIGIYSNGVAGVGELNTGYYDVDGIHLNNATGFPYGTTKYITPAILLGL